MAKYAEILITINPVGVEKAEVIGIEDDAESERIGVEMYQKLAICIHNFAKETRGILEQAPAQRR